MMFKRPGLPKWDCHSQAEQDHLEAWTNEQLDPIADCLPESLVRQDAEMHDVAQAMLSDKKLFQRTLARVRIDTAVRNKDAATVERLTAEHPELLDFAVQRSEYKRGRGRLQGERRRNDWSGDEIDVLPHAVEAVYRIRIIWKAHFGKQNRGDTTPPTAVGIAARRYGLTEERLRAMLKNRNRRYRGIGII